MKEKLYCVKRLTDGNVWLDTCTISVSRELAREKADVVDKQIPKWAAENPQIQVVPVSLEEIDED